MATQETTTSSTWGIPTRVRRVIRSGVLDLRRTLEDDFDVQLTALAVRKERITDLPANRPVSDTDARARQVAVAVIEQSVSSGMSYAEARDGFVRECAYTFLNRAVGLRCMEERGLLLVAGLPETAVTIDPVRGMSSLAWRIRSQSPSIRPDELWRQTLRQAWTAVSERIRVIFDPESEYVTLLPRQGTIQKVIDFLNSPAIPTETWTEDELLGWVYQYYNAEEKDEVYARLGKGKKLETARDIAAATTLYTERYMVDYLLQNTLGTMWVEMHPETRLKEDWAYYVTPPEGNAKVDREVKRVRDITILDPAAGGCHFLVRAFDMFASMYVEEGIESASDIPVLILERNLYGIDIDARAIQIGALALYLKGCGLAGPGFQPRRLNLVSTDISLPSRPPNDYLKRFQGDTEMEEMISGIWSSLRNTPEFGSLLHPERAVDAIVKRRQQKEKGSFFEHSEDDWGRWKIDLLAGLRDEFEQQAQSEVLTQRIFGEQAAKGIGLVDALSRRYDTVVANPPYAGNGGFNAAMKTFIERDYKDGKRDLYTAFIHRCLEFSIPGGFIGMVTQHTWMFLRSFTATRQAVLSNSSILTISHLGEHSFDESGAAGAFVTMFTLGNCHAPAGHQLTGFRLIGPRSAADKDNLLRHSIRGFVTNVISTPRQAAFLPLTDTPFVYWLPQMVLDLLAAPPRLGDVAVVRQGMKTADNERFTRCFWEVNDLGTVDDDNSTSGKWFQYAKGGRYQKWAGLEWLVVNWQDEGFELKAWASTLYNNSHWSRIITNVEYYFQPGITYTYMARGSLGEERWPVPFLTLVAHLFFPLIQLCLYRRLLPLCAPESHQHCCEYYRPAWFLTLAMYPSCRSIVGLIQH